MRNRILMRFVIIASMALFFLAPCNAQHYGFIQYSVREGLIQSQVRCMIEDEHGYLWAGTLGGLSRFDGRKFWNYDRQDGLPDNQVNCLLSLPGRGIAGGTSGAIFIVNGLGLKVFPLPKGHEQASVNCLYRDAKGKIWIGTEDGLFTFTEEGVITDLPMDEYVRHISETADNQILITSKQHIYSTRGGDGYHTIYETPEGSSNSLFCTLEAGANCFWVATKELGILYLQNGVIEGSITEDNGLPTSTVTGMMYSGNRMLIAQTRFGFSRIKDGAAITFGSEQGMQSADVRAMVEDAEGNLWLGTYGGGILRFVGDEIGRYDKSSGMPANGVMSITEDREGHMWTSTYEGGVFKIDNGRVTGRNEQSANAEARMWASLTDRKGRIWIGSSAGLECIQNERSVGHYDGNDLPDQTVLSLLEDKSGIIWVGTAKGLCRIENDTIKLIEVPELYRTRIRCIRQQENGTLWMATLKGVLSFDGRVWTLYDSSRGIEGNSAYCLEFDNHGKLWAGLQNGLALFNGEGFSVYHLDETSASNSINFLKNIGEDLWIGTNNGLFIIANQLDAQQIAEPIRNLGLDDGLASLETNLNAVYLDSRRRLWFGTAEGLMFIELGRFTVHEEELLPRTNLTAIQLNLQTPKWSDYGATPLATTGLPFKLELPYRNNYITFFFTGISLRYPDRINYEYMLEGLDEEWKNPTYNDFATYSNLAYQSYRFALRSRIGNGRWSDPVYYEFRILPPFWLTWWFICLEVVLTICILLFIALSRSRVMKARKDREIFELRSRMLALEQQSLNSSMNRHFIFNALNSIQYYINRQDKLAANRYLSDFAKLIRKNLDSSEDNLTTLEDEVERLELYLKLEHMRFREKFEYRITISPDLDQKKIKVPAMLIQPFLENSIWHGLLPKEGQGKIEVTVQRESGQLVFTVSDNGIGIENSLSQKPSTDGHISKGMEITQGRLELLKKMTGLNIHIIGPQQVNSDSGEAIGTVVKILFPEEFTGIGYSKVV